MRCQRTRLFWTTHKERSAESAPFPTGSGSAPGSKGLFVGGVKLPLALAELGLIDEYEFVVQPRLVGHGQRCSRGYRSVST